MTSPKETDDGWDFNEGRFVIRPAGASYGLSETSLSAQAERLEAIAASMAADDIAPEPVEVVGSRASIASAALEVIASTPPRAKPGDPAPIDSRILAQMRTAELFTILEGDVREAIEAPMDFGFKDWRIVSRDKQMRKEAEELAEALNLWQVMEDSWYGERVHGNFFLMPVVENNYVTRLITLNPKCVGIGPLIQGVRTMAYYPTSLERQIYEKSRKELTLAEDSREATPYLYDLMSHDWNEYFPDLRDHVLINRGEVIHIHSRKFPHQRYAVPHLIGASRSITTRMVLEEMIRGTIEGIKGQFWLLTIDNPRRGEVAALANALSPHRADRTGFLIWRSGLTLQQFLPGVVDRLLAPESWWRLTLDIFRKMGISVRIISGEPPGEAGRSADAEVDVRILVERLEYHRRKVTRVANRILALHHGGSKTWQEDPPTVRMADISVKAENLIRQRIAPMVQMGLLSSVSALEDAGWDAEQERERRREEAMEAYLWQPKPTFAQSVTRPGGRAETTYSKPSGGRPPETGEWSEIESSALFGQVDVENYVDAVQKTWSTFRNTFEERRGDEGKLRDAVEAFIAAMLAVNMTYRRMAYLRGYSEGGGTRLPDEAQIEAVFAFDQANLNNLRVELLRRLLAGEDISGMTRRVLMYANEGYTKAYTGGLFQARREQSYKGWQRVVRPYASRSGPCAACLEDSEVIHPMTEPFWEPHPSGVCGVQFIMFYREPGVADLPVRVPMLMRELWSGYEDNLSPGG